MKKTFNDIRLGDRASVKKTIYENDVDTFAKISGDINPVHLDKDFAESTRFKQRIAHGMLIGSLISAVLGTEMPGPGTIYLSQHLNFKAPVFFGDTITTEVEVIEKFEEKHWLRLKTSCSNQSGKIVLDGEAMVVYSV